MSGRMNTWAGNIEAVVAEALHLHRRKGHRGRYGPSWADVDAARTVVAALRRAGCLKPEREAAKAALSEVSEQEG